MTGPRPAQRNRTGCLCRVGRGVRSHELSALHPRWSTAAAVGADHCAVIGGRSTGSVPGAACTKGHGSGVRRVHRLTRFVPTNEPSSPPFKVSRTPACSLRRTRSASAGSRLPAARHRSRSSTRASTPPRGRDASSSGQSGAPRATPHGRVARHRFRRIDQGRAVHARPRLGGDDAGPVWPPVR